MAELYPDGHLRFFLLRARLVLRYFFVVVNPRTTRDKLERSINVSKVSLREIEEATAEEILTDVNVGNEPGLIDESFGPTFYNLKCSACGNVFHASPNSDLDAKAIEKAMAGGTTPLIVSCKYCYVCLERGIEESFQIQEQQLERESQLGQELDAGEFYSDRVTYLVQCESRFHHEIRPEHGSDLEQRARRHRAKGGLTVLQVPWTECPECVKTNAALPSDDFFDQCCRDSCF